MTGRGGKRKRKSRWDEPSEVSIVSSLPKGKFTDLVPKPKVQFLKQSKKHLREEGGGSGGTSKSGQDECYRIMHRHLETSKRAAFCTLFDVLQLPALLPNARGHGEAGQHAIERRHHAALRQAAALCSPGLSLLYFNSLIHISGLSGL